MSILHGGCRVVAAIAGLSIAQSACATDPPSPILFERSAIEAEFAAYLENDEADTPLIKEAARTFHDGCGFHGIKAPTCVRESPEDWAARERGAATIVAMMDILLDYEREGRGTKTVGTPYWGIGSETTIAARELRTKVFASVSGFYPRDRVFLPILSWVLRNEEDERSREDALIVLCGVKDDAATDLLAEVAGASRSDQDDIVAALIELATRAPDKAAATARQYVQDPRGKVRTASRDMLAARGEKVPDLDPDIALADLRTSFAEVLALLPESIRGSRLVNMNVRPSLWRGANGELRGFELASADPEKIRILTTSLDLATIARRDVDGEVVEVPLAEEANRVAGLRAKAMAGDRDAAHSFSRDGGLTGQFEPRVISGYEVVLASELFERGDAASAARVFLPPLEANGDPEDLFAVYRSRMAVVLYHAALESFAGDRDYETAAELAGIVADRFPGFPDHRNAARLAEQLPRRLDEFRTFTLPSKEQWEKDSRDMSRKEKIEWLCEHVRLVNAFQNSQPGGVGLSGPLYAEPSGMRNAAWAIRPGGTEVLNPIRALEDMALFPADIAIFAEYLTDDRLLPSVEFWRDFSPNRKLYTVAEIVGYMINDIADAPLIPRKGVDALDEEATRELVATALDWSKKNATREEKARRLDVLRKDQEWYKAKAAAQDLVDMNVAEAAPLVLAYLDRNHVYEERQILRTAAKLDGPKTAAMVAARLGRDGPSFKLEAGLIVTKWGDRESGYRVLREALQNGGHPFLDLTSVGEAVVLLLSSGSRENEQAAGIVFEKDYLTEAWSASRKPVLDAFGDRCGLVLRFYRTGVDTPGTQRTMIEGRIEEVPKGFRFGEEAIERYGSSRVGVDWPARGTREEKDAVMAKIRAWLDAEIARAETCTTS
jgi:hypothetical protein